MKTIASSADETPESTVILHTLEKSAHSLNVIKKAALKFTDIAAFDFSATDNTIDVSITVRSALTMPEQERLLDDFKIELLDQELREIVAKESEPVRNLILANVFSKAIKVEHSE